ncbi:MAG: hypothetical protein KGI69_01080 [Patescibacteria group bacterium]|nr:hypothetical protein [Patescibacteria group bacterium]
MKTYDLSWGRTSFLSKLELFYRARQEMRKKSMSGDRIVQAEAHSALSSAYYSITGTAAAQLRASFRPSWLGPLRAALWCFTWLPLAAWCYWRMLPLSERAVKLIGYGGMSAEQCDVRQSILRRRGRSAEARRCIDAALAKHPMEPHIRGLLYAGLAEAFWREGDKTGARLRALVAQDEAKDAEAKEPQQAARIYRLCARIADLTEDGDPVPGYVLRSRARALAESAGAHDQVLKLER